MLGGNNTALLGVLVALLFGCQNDVALVQKISFQADAPTESTKDLVLTYAEAGYARVEIMLLWPKPTATTYKLQRLKTA